MVDRTLECVDSGLSLFSSASMKRLEPVTYFDTRDRVSTKIPSNYGKVSDDINIHEEEMRT